MRTFSSPSPLVRAQAFGLCESTRYGLDDLSSCCDATSVASVLHEVESWSSGSTASAPKRIRGSASGARFEADPVMDSDCFTWLKAFVKEPDEDNERYPWRMLTPLDSEPVSSPILVGPIAL